MTNTADTPKPPTGGFLLPRCEFCGCFTKRRTVNYEEAEIVFEDCKNPKCDPYDGWD